MKTQLFKRIAVVAIGVFSVSSLLMGQAAPLQYVTAGKLTATIDSVTEGTVIPYFVMPDAILNDGFNTTYNPTLSNAAQNILSSYEWRTSVGSTGSIDAADLGKPYARVTWSFHALAEDSIWVKEVSPTGCYGDSNRIMVRVLRAPALTLRAVSDTVYYCDGEQPNFTLTIDAINDNNLRGGTMNIRYGKLVRNLSSDQTTVTAIISGLSDTIVEIPQPTVYTAVPFSIAQNLAAVNGKITEYIYTVAKGGVYGNVLYGINDHISRKSDFLSLTTIDGSVDTEYTNYNTAADANSIIQIRVFPRPITGNIYHIPNDFNN